MIRKMIIAARNKYWDYGKKKEQQAKLKSTELAYFANYMATEKENVNKLLAVGIENEIDERLEAAVSWILRAQDATPDGGVSLGFFPLQSERGWKPSYPETTGYIITSLLKYATDFDRPEIRNAALKMADWEVDVQMASGAVQGGPVCASEKQTAAAFNTGMVLDGWCSAYEQNNDDKYLRAIEVAAIFLMNDLDDEGYFKTNGNFVSQGEIKTYSCLCAWAMYRAGLLLKDENIKNAAILSVEAAVRQQNDKGWFSHNCLTNSKIPLTHTIGYVIQGIFEVGVLSNRKEFVDSAFKALSAVVAKQEKNGWLSSRFDHNWTPVRDYVCLTGSVQLAITCYRMAEVYGNYELVTNANALTNFVKATQLMDYKHEAMVGAIAGSYPIDGDYMENGYPNWATKYYIDALMLQKKFGNNI